MNVRESFMAPQENSEFDIIELSKFRLWNIKQPCGVVIVACSAVLCSETVSSSLILQNTSLRSVKDTL